MSLPFFDLLGGVVVYDTTSKVVRSCYEPILPCDEPTSSNGHIANFEAFDDSLKQSAMPQVVSIYALPPSRSSRFVHFLASC